MILEKIRKIEKNTTTNKYFFVTRITIVKYFLFFAFLLVLARSVELQIFQSKKLDQIAIKQYQNFKNLQIQRGKIFDSRGNILSTSIPYYSVFVLPKQIKNPALAIKKLAKVLEESEEQIAKKINSQKKFIWIKKFFDANLKKNLDNLQITGVHVVRDFKRYYPLKDFAAHILGFVGYDSKGLEGIEYKYNDHLLKKNTVTSANKTYEGGSIFLSIDENIQYFAQKNLAKYAKKYQALYGQVIVMESKTAAILAMANYPNYDPNNFLNYQNSIYFNRAVNAAYEPGSTFKIITIAAALEENLISANQKIYCEQGSIFIGGSIIRDSSPHSYLTLQQILQKSSNICALKIGRRLTQKKFYQYIQNFGFGKKTAIELPGEIRGIVKDYKKWSLLDLAVISYGHSISVTPIQLISAVNTIANDGVYIAPTVISKIENSLHDNIPLLSKKHKRVISVKTARIIKKMLVSVTEKGGTGSAAKILGIDVAGKTGTTKKYDKQLKKYSDEKHTLSFVGFFPAQDPELTILVILDEPQRNQDHYSAAPLFKEIATNAIRYHRLANDYEKKWAIKKK